MVGVACIVDYTFENGFLLPVQNIESQVVRVETVLYFGGLEEVHRVRTIHEDREQQASELNMSVGLDKCV